MGSNQGSDKGNKKSFLNIKFTPFLLLCIMGGLAIFSSTMAKSPVLPLFAGSLGIPDKTLGFVAAASTVVGILVSFPAATLSDFVGRRRLLLIAAFVFATAPFGYLFVHSIWSLVLVRVYHGLATAILGPIAMAAVADTYSTGRGERMAWYSSATMVGRFLAPLLGGALIMGSNYHWVYLVDGILGVFALAAALFITFPQKAAAPVVKKGKKKYRQGNRHHRYAPGYFVHQSGGSRAVFCLRRHRDLPAPLSDRKLQIFHIGNRVSFHRSDCRGRAHQTHHGAPLRPSRPCADYYQRFDFRRAGHGCFEL